MLLDLIPGSELALLKMQGTGTVGTGDEFNAVLIDYFKHNK